MGTVIKFGFPNHIKNPNKYKNQFKKLSAPKISIHKNYRIPIVFVQMDNDIKYGENNFISVFNINENGNKIVKNVIPFTECSFELGNKIIRKQIFLWMS